MTQTTDS